MTVSLQTEQDTYERILPTLAKDEGKYAVIFGLDLIGVFDTYTDALTIGYERAGVDRFLVRRVSAIASVAYFSRDIDIACHT